MSGGVLRPTSVGPRAQSSERGITFLQEPAERPTLSNQRRATTPATSSASPTARGDRTGSSAVTGSTCSGRPTVLRATTSTGVMATTSAWSNPGDVTKRCERTVVR